MERAPAARDYSKRVSGVEGYNAVAKMTGNRVYSCYVSQPLNGKDNDVRHDIATLGLRCSILGACAAEAQCTHNRR